MEITFQLQPDIQIPNYLYNEAAELFLSHLEKGYEELLLKGGNSPLTLKDKRQMKNSRKVFLRPLNHLGRSCPLYYKKRTGIYSDQQVRQSQALHTPH
ncbi:hypothetical protein ACFX5E_11710 [Flavobacterium sp. LS2P90]|uniref:Uncharacterized protein n=1 Tax=Flavobacterium xylosi TaxID=3230415 RepID=A0ABW6HXJ1_9FLAO